MTIKILDNGWISDSFEMGTSPDILIDALCMPPDQYYSLTQEEIEQMKKDRYYAWLLETNPILKNSEE
jgi:hypothetical protein